ncbi:MAG: MATE family efflux transporter [Edaphocola sp.]
MSSSITYRQILRLAVPISVSLLIPQISFMANAVFLGEAGKIALVANGLAGIYYLLLTYIGFGLSNGLTVLLSRRAGQQDEMGMGGIFSNGLMLAMATSLTLVMLSLPVTNVLYHYTIKEPAIRYNTLQFLHIRLIGLPFLLTTQVFNALFISINRSRMLIYGAIAGNATNILLDYLLINGHGGLPVLGLTGAAVASVLGDVAATIVMTSLYFTKKFQSIYKVSIKKLDKTIVIQTLKVAAPLLLQYIFSIGGWQLFYIYVEHLGVTQLATSHILRSVMGIVSIGTWALAATANTLVSKLIGAGKNAAVLPLALRVILLSVGYTLGISCFLFFFPERFMGFYSNKADVVAMGIGPLRVLACSSLVMSVGTICFNSVMGTGNTLINLGIETFCVCSYILYVTIVVEWQHSSLTMAFTSELVYWGLLLVVSGSYLLSGRWKGKEL